MSETRYKNEGMEYFVQLRTQDYFLVNQPDFHQRATSIGTAWLPYSILQL